MSAHKVTLNTNVYITPKLSINPTFIAASRRYAYGAIDEDGELVSTVIDPYLLTNVFVNYQNLVPGLTLGAGIYDILNDGPGVPQAYNGGLGAYGAIPARSREYVIKLAYQVNFKK
jgi:hypothetical protein